MEVQRRYWRFVWIVTAAMTLCNVHSAGAAQPKSVVPSKSDSAVNLAVQDITLPNGMTILVVERPGAPVFSSYIVTAVGSANEKPGQIGAAHFLEHMLFKGTTRIGTKNFSAERQLMDKQDSVWNRIDAARQQSRFVKLNGDSADYASHLVWISRMEVLLDSLIADESLYVVPNEYENLYTQRGGVGFNASTGYDFTDYIVSLPSNQLEMWFVMEADRLKNAVLREFYAERDVILEERRLKVDNEGEGKLFEQFIATAFAAHPYQLYWEWRSDQGNLKRESLKAFHRQFYAPNRMVCALVGDIKFADVKKYAEKYWADFKRQPEPEPVYTVEPAQTGEKRVEVAFDASPVVMMGFHKGAFDDPDEPAFDLLQRILGDGRSSRLYKALVLDWQLCSDIGVAQYPGGRAGDLYPDLFHVSAYPKEGVASAVVEDSMIVVIRSLAGAVVTERELQKAKNNYEADFVWSYYQSDGLAEKLAQYQSVTKDWRGMQNRLDAARRVTPAQIQAVAAKYLTAENRTVATLIPVSSEGGVK